MAKYIIDGEVVSGSTDTASSIKCKDAAGNDSNVQFVLNTLSKTIEELSARPAPVTLQTGTLTPGVSIITNNTSSHTITFENAFDSIPTVNQTTTWSGKDPGGSVDNRVTVSTTISDVTRTGFSVTFKNTSSQTLYAYNISMQWRAEA